MVNHKQMLADFYLKLLSIPEGSVFRNTHIFLYRVLLEAISYELVEPIETIERIFQRMANEDVKQNETVY
jgi:hypothetical protein